ncbi:MAG: hypothetical protein FWF46_03015 [Oscillospiraceae bacterium]|nr:hypothetical protein [Oscillospiraceae bacterium]
MKEGKRVNNKEKSPKIQEKPNKNATSKKQKEQEIKEQKHIEKVLNEINQQIISSKKIPRNTLNAILKKIFPNLLIGVGVLLFLTLLLFGYINVRPSSYGVDLKVFSIMTVLLAIFVMENAYKKDSAMWVMYAIEVLVVSFFVLSLTYIYEYQISIYQKYLLIPIIIFACYYIISSFSILAVEVKKYRKSSGEIQKILK